MVHASHAWLIIIDSYILFSILMWAFILFFFCPLPFRLGAYILYKLHQRENCLQYLPTGLVLKMCLWSQTFEGIDILFDWLFKLNVLLKSSLHCVFPSYSVFIFIKYKKWIDLWALFVWLKRNNYSNQLNLDTKNDFFFQVIFWLIIFPIKWVGVAIVQRYYSYH